ncbi:TadE/TadG family type IV pilus assembly protein [Ornithinibacillus scapharcae]|uniref:TadE/TadG family type IV pilus assembly protein n=1 Tax=Ornithinibacillus scapharcae TaxID=1147159 RepID=UPI000225B3F9|nr:TadE family protein [Ornithinibacillus scapharcae]
MKWLDKFKSERGSATLEFIGIVPLAFLLLAIIIQFVVIVNAALITQSAANEAASVYSVTKSESEATNAANKILNATGDYLSGSASIAATGEKDFDATVNVQIDLFLLPESIGGYIIPLLPYSATASGRVIE